MYVKLDTRNNLVECILFRGFTTFNKSGFPSYLVHCGNQLRKQYWIVYDYSTEFN